MTATTGTYTFTSVSDANCTGTVSGSATVSNYIVPTADITGGGAICNDGSSTTVVVNLSGTAPWNFTYSDGTNTYNQTTASSPYTITTSTGGTYTLISVDDANCTGTVSGSATVTVNPLPAISVSPLSPLICAGGSISLTASGASTYLWSPATGLSSTSGASVNASPTVTTTYTVNGTDANGCTSSTTVTVTVASSVVADAGADATICLGQSTQLNATGGSTFTWTPATGLSDPNIANPTASPTVTTTYQLISSSGTCSDTDLVTININPLPIPVVNPAAPSVCAGNSVLLTATGGINYNWYPSTGLSATTNDSVNASPASTSTYSVIVADLNGCVDSTSVTVTVNPLPVISVNPDTATICLGSSATLTASGAGAGGNYTWSPATGITPTTGATITALPQTTTTYTVIGTTAAGCTNSALATVVVNNPPVISITPLNPSICQGDSTVLTASGASSYTWSPSMALSSSTGSTVTSTPNNTTSYIVTGTDPNGCTSTASTTVSVSPTPNVSVVPASPAICAGDSVALTANGASSYTWSPGAGLSTTTGTTVTAFPTATTGFMVMGIDANGCTDTATVTVTINSIPNLNFTPQQAVICEGSSVNIQVSGAGSYQWSPATGLSATSGPSVNAFPTVSTTYLVTATDANNCMVTDSVDVLVNQNPLLSFSPSAPVICDGDTVSITVSGASQYSWSPASGLSATTGSTINAWPGITTDYFVSAVDANGCSSMDTITIQVNGLPQILVGAVPASICMGDDATLIASGATSYNWTPIVQALNTASDSVLVSPSGTTLYEVTGTDVNGCSASATYSLTVNPLPVLNVTATPSVICIGQNSVLSASGASQYTWSPSGTLSNSSGATVTANPANTQLYTVTGTSSAGCVDSTTITVTVNPPVSVSATADTVICELESIPLSAQASGGNNGPYYYTWSPAYGLNGTNGNSVTFSGNNTGMNTFMVVATDGCGSPADTAYVNVFVNPLPQPAFTSDVNSGCFPLTTSFTNMTSGISGSCLWDFGNGESSADCNPVFTYNSPGVFAVSLTITDTNGCEAVLPNYIVQVFGYPEAEFTAGPQPTTEVNPVISFNSELSSSDVVQWFWQFDSLGTDSMIHPEFQFPHAGTYMVTLTVWNQNGCMDTVLHEIVISPDVTVYIPNAFTPNGDGLNDYFAPIGVGLIDNEFFEMRIYNRWGELAYFTSDVLKPWDGTTGPGGNDAPQDVYVYQIRIQDANGVKKSFTGHVSLIR